MKEAIQARAIGRKGQSAKQSIGMAYVYKITSKEEWNRYLHVCEIHRFKICTWDPIPWLLNRGKKLED
jgi:hypothetical protein